MDDIAALGLKIDSSQVQPAAASLDVLTTAGARAEKQTDALSISAAEFSAALKANNGDMNAAVASLERVNVQAKATATGLAGIGTTAGAGAIQFRTLQQSIDASLGLTDASFKKASASADVFAQSLQGVASIAASSAEQIDVANSSIAESLLATGQISAETAAAISGSYEVEAAAATESAAVQVAAHSAIGGSSVKLRETLVLLREASVGNFTRMAGSASILLGAFGLLQTVLVPLLAVGAVGFAGIALATHELNQENGDLTDGLGLTEAQLGRVKDRGIEMGDTLHAVFQVLEKDIVGALGAAQIAELSSGWATFIGGISLGFRGLIGEANVLIELMKRLDVSRDRSKDVPLNQAFMNGANGASQFMTDVATQAQENAITRIMTEAGTAGKTPKDSAVDTAAKTLQELADETKATQGYSDALHGNDMALGAVNLQQKEDQALKSVIAKIELDTKLSLQQKLDLINRLRDAQSAYDQELIHYNILQDTAKGEQQLTIMETQLTVIGKTATAQAAILATVKAQQELSNKGYDPTKATKEQSQAAEAYIQNQVDLAVGAVRLTEAQNAYNDSLHFTSDLMTGLSDQAKDMASGLSDAFGTVGKAIEDLASTFTDYTTKQAKFVEQQAAIDKLAADGQDVTEKQILLTQQKDAADTSYYANVLGAAKEFFAQGSAGYRLLQAAETAYRAYQLVASIQAMIQKTTEAGVSVAADTAAATAAGTRAVANAAADTPFPFNLAGIATVVAILAGFGVLLSGSGGGATAAPPPDVAKDRQAAQGSGTVLGDTTAKSDSIAKSIDQLTKDTNRDLEYSNEMVTSLQAIEQGINSLTSLLAQQLQVGGFFDTSGLGLGSSSNAGSGLIGSLISSIFGSSSTTKTLIDQGINIIATTIGNAVSGGIEASAFQTVQTVKKSSALFGLISSTKTTTTTATSALPTDFTSGVSDIIAGLRNTVLTAATQLGVQGAQQVIDAMSVNIGTISFKDMTGDQIQSTLNSVFSKLGDQLAKAIIPQLSEFQQAGEGALETLSRLAAEYQTVDDAQKTVGFQFTQTGISSLEARDRLVQLSGGLDQFTSQAGFFVDNFLTSAQALAPVATAVNDALTALGITGVKTKDQFTTLVQGIDTSTAAGAALYAELMNIAPAFAKVADAASDIAGQRLDLQIQILKDSGDATAALALERQKELASLDASLIPLQEADYAIQDLNTANDNLATTTKALTDAQNSYAAAQNAVVDAQDKLNQLLNPTIDANTQLGNSHSTLVDAYNLEEQALAALIQQLQASHASLLSFGQSLNSGDAAYNNPVQQYAVTKRAFNSTAAAAAGGDQTAIANLQQAGTDFLTASRATATNAAQYNSDLAAVKAATEIAASKVQDQIDTATQQLAALNASVSQLGIINGSILATNGSLSAVNGSVSDGTQVINGSIAATNDNLLTVNGSVSDVSDGVLTVNGSVVTSNGYLVEVKDGVLSVNGSIVQLADVIDTSNGAVYGGVLSISSAIAAQTVAQAAVDASNAAAIATAEANLAAAQAAASAAYDALTTATQDQTDAINADNTAIANAITALQGLTGDIGDGTIAEISNQSVVNLAIGQAITSSITDLQATIVQTQAIAAQTTSDIATAITATQVVANANLGTVLSNVGTSLAVSVASVAAVLANLSTAITNLSTPSTTTTTTTPPPDTATSSIPAPPAGTSSDGTWSDTGYGYIWIPTSTSDALNAAFNTFPNGTPIPGHANGISNVPFDNYVNRAHAGEAILTKAQATEWRGRGNSNASNDNSGLVAEVRQLRQAISTLAPMSKNLKQINDVMQRVTQNDTGNSINVNTG